MHSSARSCNYGVLAILLTSALLLGCSSRQQQQSVTAREAAPVARHRVSGLKPVMFSPGSSYVEPSQDSALDADAEIIRNNPHTLIYIDGYTDASPYEEGNPWLSNVRADQVAWELEQRGVPYYQLVTRGYGDAHPVATNETGSGRSQNRRVEVVGSD